MEYVRRFVRLASRYEEETIGYSSIDYPSMPYSAGRLGSGLVYPSSSSEEIRRELSANAGRIEGWRRTKSYDFHKEAWVQAQQKELRPIKGIDLHHQIARLRFGKKMPADEVEAILRKLKEGVQTDEQVIEVRLLVWQIGSARAKPHLPAPLIFTLASGRATTDCARSLPYIRQRSRSHCYSNVRA